MAAGGTFLGGFAQGQAEARQAGTQRQGLQLERARLGESKRQFDVGREDEQEKARVEQNKAILTESKTALATLTTAIRLGPAPDGIVIPEGQTIRDVAPGVIQTLEHNAEVLASNGNQDAAAQIINGIQALGLIKSQAQLRAAGAGEAEVAGRVAETAATRQAVTAGQLPSEVVFSAPGRDESGNLIQTNTSTGEVKILAAAGERPDVFSEPYLLNGNLVQENLETNEIRAVGARDDPTIAKVVAPILEKLSAGQTLTPGEQGALDAWQATRAIEIMMRDAIAGAAGTPPPAVQTPDELTPDQELLLQQARDAIAAGKDETIIRDMVRESGVNPDLI